MVIAYAQQVQVICSPAEDANLILSIDETVINPLDSGFSYQRVVDGLRKIRPVHLLAASTSWIVK